MRLDEDGLSGRITCPANIQPAPGQYLAAVGLETSEPLPVILYPSGGNHGEIEVAPPLPSHWTTGMELTLRGPLGKGFHLPPSARRLALASLEGAPYRLLPLAQRGLAQQAAVTIYAQNTPFGLPAEVEVLPLDLLVEAPGWADFIALDVPQRRLGELRERLGLKPFQGPTCPIQVLVIAEMPCGGLARCGICAVALKRGWALACSDGPVFDFNQLEGV